MVGISFFMKLFFEKKWLPHRARNGSVTTIVLHSTAGGSATGSISWLRKIGLSYHYIIERDGSRHKLVPASSVAFHAGKSIGPNGSNVNNYSIGISFANLNDGKEKITDAQIEAARQLVRELTAVYPSIEFITTHRLISWRRKTDPRRFDFVSFTAGLGLKAWRQSEDHPWNG